MPGERKNDLLALAYRSASEALENFKNLKRTLTVTVDVNGTGVTLAVVVGVGLIRVSFENTVVTAIANVVSVSVVLGRIVHFGAVILKSSKKHFV